MLVFKDLKKYTFRNYYLYNNKNSPEFWWQPMHEMVKSNSVYFSEEIRTVKEQQ